MPSNDLGSTAPTDHAFPSETVLLVPAPSSAVPLRPPDGAWGLVVVAVRTTDTARTPVRLIGDAPAQDPTRVGTADLLAGVWLPTRPPAHLHTGDVVVRLQHPYTSHNPADPTRADVVVLAAADGEWRTIRTWGRSMGARWPHEAAPAVLWQMRYLADAAFNDAQWTTLAGPIAAALPPGILPAGLVGSESADSPAPRAPDALADLIDAGLIEVGEQLVWNGHTATVREGGVLHDGGPHEFAVSTVTALATSLAGYTVNGWHLWRRAHDNRPLSELRTALATRSNLRNPPTRRETAMTTSITERDQDAGATSTRYHCTRVVEIAGRTVRARVERGLYSNDSGAVAEVLTDRAEWSSLAADALNNWWHDTPPPSPDVHAAAVLGPQAERLLHRAAEILAAPPPTVTLSPHLYRAVSALLATSSGFNGECRIDPDDIVWATSHGGALHIFEHPDGGVTFTKAHRDECPFVASKGSQDCDDECYFDLPHRA